ncbi:MAG: hypothetical protein P9M14_00950, partial [Candidatus Alcyoniella australis]|nr:hypothetical protein [Candidatus Alcyoniella australis]
MSAKLRGSSALLSLIVAVLCLAAVVVALLVQPENIDKRRLQQIVLGDGRINPSQRISSVPDNLKISGIYNAPLAELSIQPPQISDAEFGGDDPLYGELNLGGLTVYMRRTPAQIAARIKPRKADAEQMLLLAGSLCRIGEQPQANRVMRDYAQRHEDDPDAWRTLADYFGRRALLQDRVKALGRQYELLVERYGKATLDFEREQLKTQVLQVNAEIIGELRRGLLESDLTPYRLRVLDVFPDDWELFSQYMDELRNADDPYQMLRAVGRYGDRFEQSELELLEYRAWAYESLGELQQAREAFERAGTPLSAEREPLFERYLRWLAEHGELDGYRRELEQQLDRRFDLQALWKLVLLREYSGLWRGMDRLVQDQAQRLKDSSPKAQELFDFARLCSRAGLHERAQLYFYNVTLAAQGELLQSAEAQLAHSLVLTNRAAALPGGNGAGALVAAPFISARPGISGGLLSLGLNSQNVRGALRSFGSVGDTASNRELALGLIERALARDPQSQQASKLTRDAVVVLRDLGLYNRALTQLEKFVEQNPQHAELPQMLQLKIEVARAADDTDQELNTYKQLLELYDERGLQQRYHATLRTYIGRLVSLKHYDRVL